MQQQRAGQSNIETQTDNNDQQQNVSLLESHKQATRQLVDEAIQASLSSSSSTSSSGSESQCESIAGCSRGSLCSGCESVDSSSEASGSSALSLPGSLSGANPGSERRQKRVGSLVGARLHRSPCRLEAPREPGPRSRRSSSLDDLLAGSYVHQAPDGTRIVVSRGWPAPKRRVRGGSSRRRVPGGHDGQSTNRLARSVSPMRGLGLTRHRVLRRSQLDGTNGAATRKGLLSSSLVSQRPSNLSTRQKQQLLLDFLTRSSSSSRQKTSLGLTTTETRLAESSNGDGNPTIFNTNRLDVEDHGDVISSLASQRLIESTEAGAGGSNSNIRLDNKKQTAVSLPSPASSPQSQSLPKKKWLLNNNYKEKNAGFRNTNNDHHSDYYYPDGDHNSLGTGRRSSNSRVKPNGKRLRYPTSAMLIDEAQKGSASSAQLLSGETSVVGGEDDDLGKKTSCNSYRRPANNNQQHRRSIIVHYELPSLAGQGDWE